MIRNKLLSTVSDDCAQLRQIIEKCTTEIDQLPVGTLFTRTTRGKKRYYRYLPAEDDTKPATETYLGKAQEKLIFQLARRKFIELSIESLNHNIEMLQHAFSGYTIYDPEEVRQRMPKAYEGIECSYPTDAIGQNNPSSWAYEPYEKSTLWPDALKHRSHNGIPVRSKSEAMIASQLELYDIPYRYEQRLEIADHIFYPDFTILNPEDNQIIYWEHFGLMDDEDYGKSVESKMNAYHSAGIFQWDSLITTYETKRRPLDSQKVRRVIKAVLLQETI